MTLPGTVVNITETAPPRSAPTETGPWFIVGLTQKGDPAVDSKAAITSMAEYKRRFGDRTASTALLYDSADAYFHEGGARLYVGRVLASSAATAGYTFNDGSAVAALRVQASSPGVWGNDLNAEVLSGDSGGTFKIKLTKDSDSSWVLTSPDLADQDAALAWAVSVPDIKVIQMTSTADPAVHAVASLTGGADNIGSLTDNDWATGLGQLGADLGSGQVSAPGQGTSVRHGQLLGHAAVNNRVALLDAADTSSAAALISAASQARGAGDPRYGALFAPWAVIPGIVAGTTRQVPYSSIEAGLIARSDAATGNANVAAAGANGRARYALDLTQPPWSDDDRENLNDAGVSVARVRFGTVVTYGYRSLVDPLSDQDWVQFTAARLAMQIKALADVIGDEYQFDQIDGRKHLISAFGGALAGMLLDLYNDDALYGETAQDAFNVDVGDQVNTPEKLADGILSAQLAVRQSPFAERIVIDVTKVRITEAVA